MKTSLASDNFFAKNSFVILLFSCSIGAFFGKSSLLCFEIYNIEIATVSLGLMVGAFGYIAEIGGINVFIEIALVFFVGVTSGVALN